MDDRLQKFARLVEIGSFTRAAKELHISQPALTIAINKLEQELGTELLIRSNRKLELTEAGKNTYQAAIEHQNITDHLWSQLSSLAKKRPTITLGMTDSVAAVLCATAAFDRLELEADVTIVVNNSRYLREAVEHRQLDIAFIIDDGSEHSTLQARVVGTEELVLVCHPAMQDQASIGLSQGKLRSFICYDKPSTTYRHIQTALHALGIRPHVTLFSTSPDVMLRMALRGKGVAALPRFLVQEQVGKGELSVLEHNNHPVVIERPVCTVQLQGKSLAGCLRVFAEGVRIG